MVGRMLKEVLRLPVQDSSVSRLRCTSHQERAELGNQNARYGE